jgi:hypothetical protein
VLTREELTEPECAVWDAIAVGTLVELPVGVPTPADPAAGGSWGKDRQVRAQLLYELLTANPGKDVRPRGLKVVGARITGTLDLEAAELLCPVRLERCWFDEPVNMAEARVPALRLPGCHLPGLRAEQLTTRGNLELNEGFTAKGEIRLHGAHIGGRLDFTTAALSNPDGPALDAGRLAVDQSMFCFDGFTAKGEVNLGGAHIGGRLSFTDAILANPMGAALFADGLVVDQDVFCSEGFTVDGEIHMGGAQVGGDLDLTGATLNAPSGYALRANRLTVGQNMLCRSGFNTHGEVCLVGARIAGDVDFAGARLANDEGPALYANRLTVGLSVMCRDGFSAQGEVRLLGAHIGGRITFATATLSNLNGLALQAERLTVEQDLFFTEGFGATGEIHLAGAHVGGTLSFEGATLAPNGGTLTLPDLRASTLILRPAAAPGCVDLTHAHVDVLADDPTSWPSGIRLRGFVYDALDEHSTISAGRRLKDWLSRDSEGYVPQPFEQLAAVYRKGGRDDDARKVIIAKQRRRRSTLTLPGRLWNLLLYWTIGYGYRTWQAGLWLLGFLLVSWVVFAEAYPAHMTATKAPGQALPHFQPFVYALDTLLPVVDLDQQANWIPQGLAQWWAWVSILAGWLLTTAVVAALTGLIKKD